MLCVGGVLPVLRHGRIFPTGVVEHVRDSREFSARPFIDALQA